MPNDTSYTPWVQGLEMGIFIKNATGSKYSIPYIYLLQLLTGKLPPTGNVPFIGKVWPGFTGWVDWTHPGATTYWTNQIRDFLNTVPLDGIYLYFLEHILNDICFKRFVDRHE